MDTRNQRGRQVRKPALQKRKRQVRHIADEIDKKNIYEGSPCCCLIIDVLARQERYKDLLREAALDRLIQAARPRPTGSGRLYRKAANWFGTKMVSWGCKLLRSDTAPAGDLQPQL